MASPDRQQDRQQDFQVVRFGPTVQERAFWLREGLQALLILVLAVVALIALAAMQRWSAAGVVVTLLLGAFVILREVYRQWKVQPARIVLTADGRMTVVNRLGQQAGCLPAGDPREIVGVVTRERSRSLAGLLRPGSGLPESPPYLQVAVRTPAGPLVSFGIDWLGGSSALVSLGYDRLVRELQTALDRPGGENLRFLVHGHLALNRDDADFEIGPLAPQPPARPSRRRRRVPDRTPD